MHRIIASTRTARAHTASCCFVGHQGHHCRPNNSTSIAAFPASVRWKHSPRTSSTTASAPEWARASGWRRTHISKYVGYSWLCVGQNDWRLMALIRRSFIARCCCCLNAARNGAFGRFASCTVYTRGLALSPLQRIPDE